MTKRLTIFLALVLACTGLSTQASAQNHHALIEEFTSSTCPPCASTDPIIRQAIADLHDSITIIRWHQNYPEPGDPSNLLYPAGRSRADYYQIGGIPAMLVNGGANFFPSDVATVEGNVNSAIAAMPNYYTMSVKQTVTADSIIAFVTVTTGATVPDSAMLRMGVAICERYAVYQGSNGLPIHDYMGRQMLPGLTPPLNSADLGGKLTDAAAFNQAANTTKTYRYAAMLKSGWNPTMLDVVAFIQSAQDVSASEKPVYQSAWTENLNVDVTANNTPGMLVGDGTTLDFNVMNNSSSDQKLVVALVSAPTLASTPLTLKGVDLKPDGSITIPGNTSSTISVVAPGTGPYKGWGNIGLTVRTVDSIGVSGGWGLAIGKDIKTLVLDNGAGFEGAGSYHASIPATLTSLSNLGIPAASVRYERMTEAFSDDWSNYNNIVLDMGPSYYWFTGDAVMGNVTTLLGRGGNVVLESQIASVGLERFGSTPWWEATFQSDTTKFVGTAWTSMSGVANDPIGNGLTSILIQNSTSTTGLKPIAPNGYAIFTSNKGDVIATRATVGKGKTVYTTFQFGDIKTSINRDTVIRRIFDWFAVPAAVSEAAAPTSVGLSASQNPFSSSTNISYVSASNEANVTMTVVDLLGREVVKLAPVRSNSNTYSATIYGAHLATGAYHVVVRSSAGMKQIPVMITR